MKRKAILASVITLIVLLVAAYVANPAILAQQNESSSLRANGNLVEVTAGHLTLDGPDQIPSGWTTFRLHNVSDMTHFAVLERLPEGIGVEDQQAEVAPVFQEGMDLLNGGMFEEALAKFGELPGWFFEIVFMGGPGLIAPGGTAQTTVYLEPGTYMLECYVKTDGIFHSFNPDYPPEFGKVHEITVTEDVSKGTEPNPTLELNLSSGSGIQVVGDLRPGLHTIAVHFEDQTVHEHFLGHDVHLVRLEEDTDISDLETWMDWTQPTGLENPAPAEFLGGVHEMPAGETGYFTVLLKPGRYAWIAEVPNAFDKGMLVEFRVPTSTNSGN